MSEELIHKDLYHANISANQIVTLNKGDTFVAPLFINIGTKVLPIRYPLTNGDTIYVAIMEAHQPFECAIIRKKYTKDDINEHGDVILRLESKDTENLLPGTYYYQVKLEHVFEDKSNFVETIVPKRKLFLIA